MIDIIDIPSRAQAVIDALEAGGYEAYVVGGCVRDALLGRVPADWDITTSARPEQTKDAAAAAGFMTADTGIKHGTVTVIVDHEPFEVTTFRGDGTYSDGRHPDDVEFLDNLAGDLARRDFTVNAMAYNARTGVVDEFGGRADLAAGTLRAVGDARTRFTEDALRIMRAVRFSAQLGSGIEPQTAVALHECKGLLERISVERIAVELQKLACAQHCVEPLLEYADVLAFVIPEIEPCIGFEQHNPYHCYDVWEHCVRACDAAPAQSVELRLAALFHDIGKPATFFVGEDDFCHFYGHRDVSADLFHAIAKRLKLPRKLAERVELLVRYHDAPLPTTSKGMRRWAVKFGPDVMRLIFQIHRADIRALAPDKVQPGLDDMDEVEAFFERAISAVHVFSTKDLAIDGRDVMDAGVPAGPQVGRALQALLDAVVDGELPNEREALLEYATRFVGDSVV